jgi:hypothetical protein
VLRAGHRVHVPTRVDVDELVTAIASAGEPVLRSHIFHYFCDRGRLLRAAERCHSSARMAARGAP